MMRLICVLFCMFAPGCLDTVDGESLQNGVAVVDGPDLEIDDGDASVEEADNGFQTIAPAYCECNGGPCCDGCNWVVPPDECGAS